MWNLYRDMWENCLQRSTNTFIQHPNFVWVEGEDASEQLLLLNYYFNDDKEAFLSNIWWSDFLFVWDSCGDGEDEIQCEVGCFFLSIHCVNIPLSALSQISTPYPHTLSICTLCTLYRSLSWRLLWIFFLSSTSSIEKRKMASGLLQALMFTTL